MVRTIDSLGAWLAAALFALVASGNGQPNAQPARPRAIDSIDTIRLAAGGERKGTLLACVGGSCQMAGSAPIARRDIAAIGLGGAAPTAAPGTDDIVVFRDGPPRPVSVFGISPVDVVTAAGPFDRPGVTGVVFARASTPAAPGATTTTSSNTTVGAGAGLRRRQSAASRLRLQAAALRLRRSTAFACARTAA